MGEVGIVKGLSAPCSSGQAWETGVVTDLLVLQDVGSEKAAPSGQSNKKSN